MITTHHGDCLEVLPTLPADSIDAVVTDPPYELGFMSKGWDRTGIANSVRLWSEVLRVLKPGGHLVSFSGTRTYHRMVCAIEDAGFEIRDQLAWVYGQGFPKSLDVSKAIDKAAGVEREKIAIGAPVKRIIPGADQNRDGSWIKDNGREYQPGIEIPATDAARQRAGWGTALKPAYENICWATKPVGNSDMVDHIGSNIASLWGRLWSMLTANIAEKSFGLNQKEYAEVCAFARWSAEQRSSTQAALKDRMGISPFVSALISSLSTVSSWKDTWAELSLPENTSIIETELKTTIDWRTLKSLLSRITPESIILAHKKGLWSIADASPAVRTFSAIVAKLSSTLELSALGPAISAEAENCRGVGGKVNVSPICLARKPLSEKTVAANVLRWGTGAINVDGCRVEGGERATQTGGMGRKANPVFGKFANAETEALTTTLGRWPANLCHDGSDEVVALFPETKSGALKPYTERHENATSFKLAREKTFTQEANFGSAARFFYCAKASKDDRAGSKHPTVKPVKLMQWLIRLVTPPNGVILDPFAGSGTTGQAAEIESFHSILIEREAEYQADIRRRQEMLAMAELW